MPVAVVQDWVEEETDRSTVNYDAISERLGAMEDPPKGMLMHSAGFTGSGFRIFEVWETQADFDIFTTERLMPIVMELSGSVSAPPDLTIYELHNYLAV
jgi:hypothetical protein